MQTKLGTNNSLLTALQAKGGDKTAGKQAAEGELLEILGKQEKGFAQTLKDIAPLHEENGEKLLNFFGKETAEAELPGKKAIAKLADEVVMSKGKGKISDVSKLMGDIKFDGKKFVNSKGEMVTPAELKEIETLASEQVKQKISIVKKANTTSNKNILDQVISKKPKKLENTEVLEKSQKMVKNEAIKIDESIPNKLSQLTKGPSKQAHLKNLGSNHFVENKMVIDKKNGKVFVSSKEGPKAVSINSTVSKYQKQNALLNDSLIQKSFPEGGVNALKDIEAPKESIFSSESKSVLPEMAGTSSLVEGMNNSEKGETLTKTSSSTPTLDLSNVKASSNSELIQKVTNYIEQNAIQNSNSLEVMIKHDELGMFKVNAQKTGLGQQIELEIAASSNQGHKFFVDNESQLIKNLSDAGIKLSGVKIVSGSEVIMTETKSQLSQDFSNSSQDQKGGFSENSSRFGSQRGQDQGEQRRRNLWDQAQKQFYASA
jgi:hypothetical protein